MNCPRCGYQIDQDFGVITCQQCQAVLFVDLDGQIQLSEVASEASMPPSSSLGFLAPEGPLLESPSSQLEPEFAAPNSQESIEVGPPPEIPLPPQAPRPPTWEIESNQQAPLQDESVVTPEPPQSMESLESPPASLRVSDIASEISNFANETEVVTQFQYELLISGIDSSEIRDKLFEALSDRRFRWEARVLLSQITKGQLLIAKLNPAKAMILIRRLQELPLVLRWNQKRL